MAKVTVTPATFELVDFDHAEILAVVEDIASKVGLAEDVEVLLEIDEAVMPPTVDSDVSGRAVRLSISGGAIEDQRQARAFSADRARLLLGTHLLRARDRLDPGFADAPSHSELTVRQISAWDTYTEGRLRRLGVTARPQRRLYHFRLRHGFSDGIDAVFERLWQGENLTWADLDSACEETARLKAELAPAAS